MLLSFTLILINEAFFFVRGDTFLPRIKLSLKRSTVICDTDIYRKEEVFAILEIPSRSLSETSSVDLFQPIGSLIRKKLAG